MSNFAANPSEPKAVPNTPVTILGRLLMAIPIMIKPYAIDSAAIDAITATFSIQRVHAGIPEDPNVTDA